MRATVITVVHGRQQHLRGQIAALDRSSVLAQDHVVVAMDDPSLPQTVGCDRGITFRYTDGGAYGLPVAAARNAGAEAALEGGAELLIFLDVDCLPGPELVGRYSEAASQPGQAAALLCGPVAYLPPPPATGYDLGALEGYDFHPARPVPAVGEIIPDGDPRLFWSLSFALTADTWRRIGGFCVRYQGYGGEDTDFAFAAREAGVPLAWVGGASAYHQWHPTENPPVAHLVDIVRNASIFADRWGWWPMEGWLDEFVRRGLIRWDGPSQSYLVLDGSSAAGRADRLAAKELAS